MPIGASCTQNGAVTATRHAATSACGLPGSVLYRRTARTAHGPPPAVVLFAPHKTASTFFTTFLHDLSRLLGLCWYSDNAAFTYAPSDHAKCAAPSCGHGDGTQRAFEPSDGGWGDCASFAEAQIRVASTCTQREAVGSPGGTGAAEARGGGG